MEKYLVKKGFITNKYALIDDEDLGKVRFKSWHYFKPKHFSDYYEIGKWGFNTMNTHKNKQFVVRFPSPYELDNGADKLIFMDQFIDKPPLGEFCNTFKKPLDFRSESRERVSIFDSKEAEMLILRKWSWQERKLDRTDKIRLRLGVTALMEGAILKLIYEEATEHFFNFPPTSDAQKEINNFIPIWRKEEQKRLQLKETEDSRLRKEISYWRSLSGIGFEEELGKLYQRLGYEVTMTSTVADAGVDLNLKDIHGNHIIVQCKAHEKPVGVGAARDLFGTLHDNPDVKQAILASVSGFTQPTHDFVQGKPIKLLDVGEIIEMARED